MSYARILGLFFPLQAVSIPYFRRTKNVDKYGWPAAPAGRASDDEILGLSTNTARKSGRNNLAKIAEGAQANTVSPASMDAFFADLGEQPGAGDELEGDADADANETRSATGVADQKKLNGVLEANPELRDA